MTQDLGIRPTAVIVTALELEAAAVKEHLSNVVECVHEKGTVYAVGSFQGAVEWRVAVAIVGQGNPSAAAEVERAVQYYDPQILLLVGIAGALKDLDLGDVVAAEKVYGYERGKATEEFQPRPAFGVSSYPAIQRARTEASSSNWIKRIKPGTPDPTPRAIVAPIAAGEKVVASIDSPEFKLLRKSMSDAVAVEMEGIGFLSGAHLSHGVNALVVRGISDKIEGKASADASGSQPRAARHAAAFAFQCLANFLTAERLPAFDPRIQSERLERLRSESRGRSIARWQGSGVSAELANEFVDDPTVGIPAKVCRLLPGQVTVLVAEFGSGKSLATDRLYERSLADFAADRTAPVPVYLELPPGRIPSFTEFRAASETLGKIDSSGAVVFIERADEGGHAHALDCLAFARRLVSSFPRTSVLLPARPLVAFADIPEAVPLPPLTESETCALVKRVSGHDFRVLDLWRWSEAVQTAMRRPLFAILIGLYLQGEHPEREILSPGELINRVVLQALQRTRIEVRTAEHLLARLGALTVERGGDLVHYSEIGTWSEVERLLSSGLVNRNGERIGFPIPVIGQWFAAQAIQRRIVVMSDVLSDPVRRERWQDPLSIAIAGFDGVVVDDIMERLASEDPGLASLVLEDAVGRSFHTRNKAGMPLSRSYEADLRRAWNAWLSGLGSGARVAGAQAPTGHLLALRAHASAELLTVGFYPSDRDTIASDSFNAGLPPGWLITVQTGRPAGDRRAWTWQFTQERLKRGFGDGLRRHEIVLEPNCPLAVEAVWCGALAAVGKGGLYGQPIPIEQIERALETRGRGGYLESYDFGRVEVCFVQNALAKLKAQGSSVLVPPLPAPDIEDPQDNWVWSVYSDERLLERTRATYSLALAGYEHLVSRYFNKLGARMRHAATLPATLTGILRPSSLARGENDLTKSPGLDFFLDPLPVGTSSRVNIVLPPASKPLPDVRDERMWETLRGLRPTASEWLRPFKVSTVLEVFGGCPATKTAFDWVKADLRELKWL